MPRRVHNVVAVSLWLASFPIQAQTQAGSLDVPALAQEVQTLRRTVDGLVTVVKQFVTESDRRERAQLLLRRIEVGEQQVAYLSAELRTLRGQLEVGERGVQQSRGRIQSARSMAAFNPDASSAEVLLQEQTRAAADEQVAQVSVDRLQPRIAELEGEIASRRAAIRALEAQLDKELASPPR